MEKTFDVAAAIAAQKRYCEENGFPHFAPYSGICYSCGRQIYAVCQVGRIATGITVEEASSKPITGCPHCHMSFVD